MALKSKRAVHRFTDEQASFLRDIFKRGEATGHKCGRVCHDEKNGKKILKFFSVDWKAASFTHQDEGLVAEEFEFNSKIINNYAK